MNNNNQRVIFTKESNDCRCNILLSGNVENDSSNNPIWPNIIKFTLLSVMVTKDNSIAMSPALLINDIDLIVEYDSNNDVDTVTYGREISFAPVQPCGQPLQDLIFKKYSQIEFSENGIITLM